MKSSPMARGENSGEGEREIILVEIFGVRCSRWRTAASKFGGQKSV